MQKLIETLKSFGIDIPEDKQADVKKALSEHYKNAGEVSKKLSNAESERDNWKSRAETAEATLKKFDGIDPENIKTELATWKQKAADAEKRSWYSLRVTYISFMAASGCFCGILPFISWYSNTRKGCGIPETSVDLM